MIDWNKVMVDPLAAHREMALNEGIGELRSFVKHMAMDYNLYFVVFPKWDNHVSRWRDIAKLMSNNVVHGPLDEPDPEKEYKNPLDFVNQSKYKSHFRSAHMFMRGGVVRIRLGCLVNKHLLTEAERKGFLRLVDEYNLRIQEIYKDTHEFISMKEWMAEQGAQLV